MPCRRAACMAMSMTAFARPSWLAAEQAPDALDGTLIVIPVANPNSFAAGQPADGGR